VTEALGGMHDAIPVIPIVLWPRRHLQAVPCGGWAEGSPWRGREMMSQRNWTTLV